MTILVTNITGSKLVTQCLIIPNAANFANRCFGTRSVSTTVWLVTGLEATSIAGTHLRVPALVRREFVPKCMPQSRNFFLLFRRAFHTRKHALACGYAARLSHNFSGIPDMFGVSRLPTCYLMQSLPRFFYIVGFRAETLLKRQIRPVTSCFFNQNLCVCFVTVPYKTSKLYTGSRNIASTHRQNSINRCCHM